MIFDAALPNGKRQGRIDEFALGEHDTPDRLLIPEKLYGRAREIDTLLASFDRVVASGTPELVLVSGYSGIGKSSVVNELHKVLVPPRGLFASGKFDQYKRDIPYATLAQAFQSLIRPLLSKSEAELRSWRDALRGGVRSERTAHCGPGSRIEAHHQENSHQSLSFRHRTRNAASSWCSGDLSAYSHGRNIRLPCSSTICNGSTRQRSICSRIC